MKLSAVILVGGALAALVITRYWKDAFDEHPQFRTLAAMKGELFIGVTASGTVEPVEIIDVGAQIVGSVQGFGPDPDHEGKTIDYRSRAKSGAVLAQLDDLPHKAELDKAKVNLRLAESELKNAQARHKQMDRQYARAKQLRGTDSEAEFEKCEAEYEMSLAQVAIHEAKVDQSEIAKQQAEINLGYTTIRSPVDGIVIDRRVNVGQTVVAGMNAPSLFLLAKDLSRMLVWSAVNEADIGDIHVGQTVTFTVDAYRDRTFTGKVSQIRLNASLQQNVVTYGVIVDVDNTDGKLLPYMTAKLQFEVARRRDVVLVPNQALRFRPTWLQISPLARKELKQPMEDEAAAADSDEDEEQEPTVDLGSPTVWKLAKDGLVQPVPVQIGLTDGMVTEITGGELEPGDHIVTAAKAKSVPDFVSSFVSKVTDKQE